MKMGNIKFYAIADFSDGSKKYSKFFCTEQAMSNWANKQYHIDEDVTVRVYNFSDDSVYCVYHA